tara:strand:- start:211 stop:633 length:423 start_codon:yes stop_codon:yes gene_type:complete
MEFKWYLIKAKLENHAYLPRMISGVELTYALTDKTESNDFEVLNQVLIDFARPKSTKNYIQFDEGMEFENIVMGWCMEKINQNKDEVTVEEDKMKKMLYDMKSRKNLQKGATIVEQTVWGYSGGSTTPNYIDPDATKLTF